MPVCVCFFALEFFFIHSSSNSSVRWLIHTFVRLFIRFCDGCWDSTPSHCNRTLFISFLSLCFYLCHARNVVCASMSLSCILYCESKRLHSACVRVERAVVIASLVHANTNFGGKYFFFMVSHVRYFSGDGGEWDRHRGVNDVRCRH